MNAKLIISRATIYLTAANQLQAQSVYLTSSFTGRTAEDWVFTHSLGEGASLTAATRRDLDGQGWLRLTNNAAHQASFVYYNKPIPTKAGLQMDFDMTIWGSTRELGDGISLALFSTEGTPIAGGYGGSLGYAQRNNIGGLSGGILGVGFDVFGNFSSPTEGRLGGPERIRNSIALRGSMGADPTTGYEYITGVTPETPFATPNIRIRLDASIYNVRLLMPNENQFTLQMKLSDESDYVTLIDDIDPGIDLPDNIRFGFTAGTGGTYSFQEVRNISVTSFTGSLPYPVPEPSAVLLLSISMTGLLCYRRRNNR